VRGFEAGADDFLTKPVDDVALVKRVRNLARLKMLTDEMLMRASTEEQLGFAGDLHKPFDQVARGGRILLVEDNDSSYRRIQDAYPGGRSCKRAAAASRRQFRSHHRSLSLQDADGLRLCSQVRSLDRAHHLPILIIAEPDDDAPLLRGLDMGVNDYVVPDRPKRAAGEGAHPAQA
jgi:two-component system, cell cycle response regulator